MQTKIPLLILIFSALSFADIGLVNGEYSGSVVYADKNNVYYQECQSAFETKLDRKNCKPKGKLFSISYPTFIKRLRILYIIDEQYLDLEALRRITGKIEFITRDLDTPGVDVTKAKSILDTLTKARDLILKSEEEVVHYLNIDAFRTVSREYQAELHAKVFYSFYRVGSFTVGEVIIISIHGGDFAKMVLGGGTPKQMALRRQYAIGIGSKFS